MWAFPTETIDFLTELRDHNDRAWFEAHRREYDSFYVTPAKEFVEAAGERLDSIVPGINAEPRVLGSIFRINRDTRFSPDKRPYKDHLDLWFWEGERKRAVSGFFVRIAPERVGIGAGGHSLDKPQLDRFRHAVSDDDAGGELAAISAHIEAAGLELGGRRYARPPRAWAVPSGDDRRARLLLHDSAFVQVDEPVDVATEPGVLLDRCGLHRRRLAPLHRWLVSHVPATTA